MSTQTSNNNKIIRIDGLPEALSFLDSHPNALKTGLKTELNAIADIGVNEMKSNAHRLTGKMVNSISKKSEGDFKVSINVPVPYAGHENRRGNPHNFFDRGVQKIEQEAKTRIPNKIDSLLKSGGK